MRPSLPMGGVQVILGNYRIWPKVMQEGFPIQVDGAEVSNTSNMVVSTCAVTRALSRASGDTPFEDKFKKCDSGDLVDLTLLQSLR